MVSLAWDWSEIPPIINSAAIATNRRGVLFCVKMLGLKLLKGFLGVKWKFNVLMFFGVPINAGEVGSDASDDGTGATTDGSHTKVNNLGSGFKVFNLDFL